MAHYVVDASVAAKWFFEEVHSNKAELLLSGNHELIAPLLLQIELGSIFIKKARGGLATTEKSQEYVRRAAETVRLIWSVSVLRSAFDIAFLYNRSFYDALYVALVLEEGCQLVTADERMYNVLATAWPGTMLWVGDLQAS